MKVLLAIDGSARLSCQRSPSVLDVAMATGIGLPRLSCGADLVPLHPRDAAEPHVEDIQLLTTTALTRPKN